MLLKHKTLYQHCIDETFPAVNSNSRPSAADNKTIDANEETQNLIAGTLDSNTFTEIFDDDETMENVHLLWNKLTKHFASPIKFLNEVISFKVEVGTPTLAFTILTKLPEDYHNIAEKVTANTETLGNPNAILSLLHEVALKEKALNLKNNNQSVALNREIFRSKTVHYCRDGKHNPLASHPSNSCWQLHPNLR
ncbi:hypothetical protein O181_036826 [Austropuccinia psidii MF-1]|uniref:Uncharacterized protein n=1 Tax=Austropuccinia psidii MF-1 TaxID=1389203 RepID=A0A9Q3HA88_9BASI|nr:hypothetical protein [Austropuccinia psidii MF-1]